MELLASDSVGKILGHAEKLKEIIRTERKSGVVSITPGRGFSYLEIANANMKGTNPSHRMAEVGQIWVDRINRHFPSPSAAPGSFQFEIQTSVKDLSQLASLEGSDADCQHQTILFRNGSGKCCVADLGFFTPQDKPTMRSWWMNWYSVDFSLMPDLVITNHSKSNFWGSSSKDSISYIARGVTSSDIQQMLEICCAFQLDPRQLFLK